jgi:hypothetical protein
MNEPVADQVRAFEPSCHLTWKILPAQPSPALPSVEPDNSIRLPQPTSMRAGLGLPGRPASGPFRRITMTRSQRLPFQAFCRWLPGSLPSHRVGELALLRYALRCRQVTRPSSVSQDAQA